MKLTLKKKKKDFHLPYITRNVRYDCNNKT